MAIKKVLKGGKKKQAIGDADSGSINSSYRGEESASTSLLAQQIEPGTGVEITNYTGGEKIPEEVKLPIPAPAFLVLFTVINLLSYYDRGALSGTLEDLAAGLGGVDSTLQGFLGSAFMGGYMIASPIFAHMVSVYEPFNVMAFGLALWSLATALCGIAPTYILVFLGRLLTGFGEASFLCIAPPFIDKLAPNGKKSMWLSIFYSAIPVGYAMGFLFSGMWLDAQPFGAKSSWRVIFLSESVMMVPFILFALFTKCPFSFAHKKEDAILEEQIMRSPSEISGDSPVSDVEPVPTSSTSQFWESIRTVIHNPVFVLIVLGYSAQTFVTGGFAFFGISYAKQELGMSKTAAGMWFGFVTVLTGIIGTMAGGIVLDRSRRAAGVPSADKDLVPAGVDRGENDLTNTNTMMDRLMSMQVATRLVIIATLAATPAAVAAFVFPGKVAFFAFLFVAELFLFCCYSPLNNTIMWAVPFKYTPQAMALSVVIMHLLGDSLSPTAIGALRTFCSWRVSMVVATVMLLVAISVWFVAYAKLVGYSKAVDGFQFNFTDPVHINKPATPTVASSFSTTTSSSSSVADYAQHTDFSVVEQAVDPKLISGFTQMRQQLRWE